jgi:hypothetical protein
MPGVSCCRKPQRSRAVSSQLYPRRWAAAIGAVGRNAPPPSTSRPHDDDLQIFGFDVCGAIGGVVMLCPQVFQVTTRIQLLVLGKGCERALRWAVLASIELHRL